MDTFLNISRGLLGLIFFVFVSWLLSRDKKRINWKLVGGGLVLQFLLAVVLLKVPFVFEMFYFLSNQFVTLFKFSDIGAEFLFGNLITDEKTFGFIFAFRILPTIIFFAALSSMLYYMRILPLLVNLFSKLLRKFMGISGPESLASAGNIFLGHVESPLLIRPYIEKMSKSELHTVITAGFATLTGGIMAALVGILSKENPGSESFYAVHFITASIISAPSAIVMSKIIIPETDVANLSDTCKIEKDKSVNIFDALSNGTFEGVKIALNVGAILLVIISLISLINWLLGDFIGEYTGLNIAIGQEFSMEYIFGILFSPLAWIMGIDWQFAIDSGMLIGQKTVFNEIIAYSSMHEMIIAGTLSDERTIIILSYALCGFANFGTVGIMIGGLGTLAPSRKSDTARLSISALVAGSFACFITACIAGILNA